MGTPGNAVWASPMRGTIELAWPPNRELIIHSLPSGTAGQESVKSVEMLGADSSLSFRQAPDGLRITLPEKPSSKYAYVYRIRFVLGRS